MLFKKDNLIPEQSKGWNQIVRKEYSMPDKHTIKSRTTKSHERKDKLKEFAYRFDSAGIPVFFALA